MIDGFTAYQELLDLIADIDGMVDQIVSLANEAAQAQAEFDMAYKKRELYYRDIKDRPVGMLKHMVMGDEDIANLRIKADVAQAMCDANRERIMVKKKQLSAMQEFVNRDYSRS